MKHSAAEVFAYVLLDISVIIVVARIFGRVARALRQPAVVGEIVAGIALGPSLLGALPGNLDAHLFPLDVVPYLKILAQLGLVLFMFIVGLELEVALIRGRERVAGSISLASIVVPFALGAAATLILHPLHDEVNGKPVPLVGLMLFMGVAMSITAFPVLARILADRGMHRTTVGALALASAAVDDILAWTLLAFVVAVVKGGSPLEVVRIVVSSAAFAAFMFVVARPLLVRLLEWYRKAGRLTPDILAVILVGVLMSAYVTEEIGIHAIFGAFLFGTILPRTGAQALTREILERLEQICVLLLLPIFFVVTGFGVNVAGLSGSGWWQLLLVLAVAIVGKFVGAFAGARLQRMPMQQSAAIAVLMNTRGLTELVILSIGVELAVLDQDLFTMMVLMALVTTAIAEPLLRVVYPDKAIERDIEAAAKAALGSDQLYRVIIGLDATPDATTERMLRMATLAVGGRRPSEIVLSRFLDAPESNPAGLELGAGVLPDLAGMASAVEELEAFARRMTDGTAVIRAMCRFSSDRATDLQRQANAAGASVVLVSDEWAQANASALDSFDGVIVLIVAVSGRAAPFGTPGDAALAVTSNGSILVRDNDSRDANQALLLAAHAALSTGAALTALAAGSGGRAYRRLSHALDPLHTVDIAFTVVSLDDPLPEGDLVEALVLDRVGGSEMNVHDEIENLTTAHAANRS